MLNAEQGKERSAKEKFRAQHVESFSLALLKNIYFKRVEKNPAYSQRAFAKHLGLSHALLSLLFAGKKKLTEQTANKIANKLVLSPARRLLFLKEFKSTPKDASVSEEVNHIDLDFFSLVSEWQHFAILSLLETNDFKMDVAWMSKRLSISTLLVKNSIERLQRLKLIVKVDNKWKQQGGAIRLDNRYSTAATKKFQRQVIKKAVESLIEDPFEIRNMSTITFATDPAHIPYAIEKIKEFRLSLSKELENLGTKKEVYNLSIQLYPLTKR